MLWHTSTPNHSDSARKLVWIVYKTAKQELTGHLNLRSTQGYVDRQTDPLRMKLCGTQCDPDRGK